MDLNELKNVLPEYAKDLKLNLSSVLSPEGAPGLNRQQVLATALASAIAARNATALRAIEQIVAVELDARQAEAARAATSIMGMNNVYYRFLHLVGNEEYARLPARLRMSVIGNPGVEKTDFELYSLAVSAINGCGACVAAHEKVVRRAGVSAESVQSVVRIAAVIAGLAAAIESRPSGEAEEARHASMLEPERAVG